VAEAISLDAPVIEMGWRVVQQGENWVSEWEMPDNEAAWHRNSARPGQTSNVVISGHNASTGGHVFAELDELQVGDQVTLWNDKDEPLNYYVIEKNIVRTIFNSEEAQKYLQDIMVPTAKERLTLITCWPRWSNTHRLVVIAEPIDSQQ
jgi:sortase A